MNSMIPFNIFDTILFTKTFIHSIIGLKGDSMSDNVLSNVIVNKIWAISRINVPPCATSSKGNRERYAIAIKTSGKTIYTSQGMEYLSDPNHIILLPKGSKYSWICTVPGECLMIEFDLMTQFMDNNLKSFRFADVREIITLFSRLEHLWTFKKNSYHTKCMTGLYEILAKMSDTNFTNYRLSSKYDIIKPAIDFLETHYNDPGICNEQLSAISGISTVYFRKIFSEIYNTSPMKYIQFIRIEKAKDLLIGDYSVGDVATAVGFNSIYHFSRAFKKITGCSPSEFARRFIK